MNYRKTPMQLLDRVLKMKKIGQPCDCVDIFGIKTGWGRRNENTDNCFTSPFPHPHAL
jgi:hypothetical protein